MRSGARTVSLVCPSTGGQRRSASEGPPVRFYFLFVFQPFRGGAHVEYKREMQPLRGRFQRLRGRFQQSPMLNGGDFNAYGGDFNNRVEKLR